MNNTPREGRNFENQLFIIAISIKFYLENEMKDLNERRLFFKKENVKNKRKIKSSIVQPFKNLRKKIYENKDNLKAFLKDVVVESIKTSPDRLSKSGAS
ncbi:hypothetical protein MDAP_001081 [Mitosporidium daphniae]